jgi:DNA-binding MarR family transcriptional regulator/catechol 2,3-dioxygenase-like lactoylglutathione lyase family enzyme
MDAPDSIEFATPTLMRAARGAYASSIRAQLHAIGIDDLPRNGAFILAGIDTTGGPRQDLPADLGVTKQAVSQLIDTLVNRGYLDRGPDPDDRRRITLELTERGQQVVDAVLRGVAAVDLQLHERVSPDQVDAMRSALLALSEIKSAGITTGAGWRRQAPQFRRFSPIFPVRDLAAALAHYSELGFDAYADPGGEEYGFANREGVGLHLAADPGHDPAHNAGSAYLYVRDADALYEEWSRPGIGGRTRPVRPTPYKLREGSHVDPDGNLIRFGSPMAE